ncbi:hypothetical protein K438DRAFT_1901453 [Mycena galopus ATCC 62051]|nr:hypothetical protein K438DRAFT_1901453 [Mycena galopus ATCC 62051]
MATDAAQIKNEIARLTASISQHKSKSASNPRHPPTASTSWPPRSSSYVNPNYKPPTNKYIRPTPAPSRPPVSRPPPSTNAGSTPQVKEVVLNGVAFESSTRSLVRKDLPKSAAPKSKPPSASNTPAPPRKTRFAPPRQYKPKSSRGRGRVRGPVNMTLTNSRRPYTSSRPKRQKSDKPCPRFSTTGTCTRGLTCPYTHDPATTAICWPFLSGTCPLPAAQCALSHDPTPERTPLCTHFLAGGAGCTRPSCPFPHVNLGPRAGICRAFAVLGFCTLGLDCPSSHVRECPDFAEKGTCARKGCRLPHVIRAAGARKLGTSTSQGADSKKTEKIATDKDKDIKMDAAKEKSASDAEMGDEFISLTFNESSEDEGSDEESESESESDASGADVEAAEAGDASEDDDGSEAEEDGDEKMDGGGGGD